MDKHKPFTWIYDNLPEFTIVLTWIYDTIYLSLQRILTWIYDTIYQ